MTVIELVTELRTTPERAFDVSLDVGVHTGSMSRSGERTVGGTLSGQLKLGDSVTFAARHFGVPWRMTARITDYERPGRFVDEQTRGPFRRWRHEHRFVWDEGRQLTVARDVVDFVAPGGVTRFLVPYMRRLLVQRNAYLAELVVSPGSPGRPGH